MLRLILMIATLIYAKENWDGFDYEMAGLSRSEYQILLKSDIDESTFYELMKLGVKPSEYLAKPWVKLGINQEDWWKQRKLGMSDEDLDQSWKAVYQNRNNALISLLIPGYYQYKNHQYSKGILINSLNFVGLLGFSWLRFGLRDPNASTFLYLAASGNIYSFVDAWIEVQSEDLGNGSENFSSWTPPQSQRTLPLISFRF